MWRPRTAPPARTVTREARRWYYESGATSFGFKQPVATLSRPRPRRVLNPSEAALALLVDDIRKTSHVHCDLNPLYPPPKQKSIDVSCYGLSAESRVAVDGIVAGLEGEQIVGYVVEKLQRDYAGSLAYEFSHLPNEDSKALFAWIVESHVTKVAFSSDEKIRMAKVLQESECLDLFLHRRFPQLKRYGLEGSESLLIVIDHILSAAPEAGIRDVIVGMAHRGRLNVLTQLLNFDLALLFHKLQGGNPEFPEDYMDGFYAGDVISHLAQSIDLKNGTHVSLLHNPSHLESVNPVVMGKVRSKLVPVGTPARRDVSLSPGEAMALQIHGDGAFPGQGITQETLQLSNLPHYRCDGTIHVIVNNQLGYTTGGLNSRATAYASDVMKSIDAPVIHVKASDVEAVKKAAIVALEYRNRMRKDVLIDLIGWRRWGHNELDEPSFTQPLLYRKIRRLESIPKQFVSQLAKQGIRVPDIHQRTEYNSFLDSKLIEAKTYTPSLNAFERNWAGMEIPKSADARPHTGYNLETLVDIGRRSVKLPEAFTVHPRLEKFFISSRLEGLESKVDWATAEALACGSLLLDGHPVRLSGQDVGRGTFSQRHFMFVDQETEAVHIPLNYLSETQAGLEIANSNLSELAVLGFEVGYAWDDPRRLVIWEAQFGDFFNGAQIVIDTFISSGEAKWFRQLGLVMLLPHGYDGTGSEHSSCRMERFLQMCNDPFELDKFDSHITNMQVVNPTTPAQYFHVLRRQMKRNFRKPLIVVGPKTLLRLPQATSPITDMGPGTTWHPVIGDEQVDPQSATTVIFCSGKFYYELAAERAKRNLGQSVAIIRIEELSPFPRDILREKVSLYKPSRWVFAQEEHRNMGPYPHIAPRLGQMLRGKRLQYAGREVSPVPATGIGMQHRSELSSVMDDAFSSM